MLFIVLFGANRVISAADALDGVTSAITAIPAARVTFFISSSQTQNHSGRLEVRRI